MAKQRLRAKRPKRPRSPSPPRRASTINLPFITADAAGPKHLNLSLSRAKMEQICEQPLRPHEKAFFELCLKDAGLTMAQVDELVLVWRAMTRMPKVIELARTLAAKRTPQGRQSGRSRRHRRGHPGQRAQAAR